jgi:hypothetical protein
MTEERKQQILALAAEYRKGYDVVRSQTITGEVGEAFLELVNELLRA